MALGVDSHRLREQWGVCSGASNTPWRAVDCVRGCRTDFLSVEARRQEGMGGTGGGGDATAGLGGGERQRGDGWARMRLSERGEEGLRDVSRLYGNGLPVPKSSSSPKRPAFALRSRRSCDLHAEMVFWVMELEGLGGDEWCKEWVRKDLADSGGGEGREVGTSCGDGIGGGGELERAKDMAGETCVGFVLGS